ncbi:hypothetical protein OS176_03355 [Xanthomonadaceae bacterium XH05]|nr:hypothetical protein [Xanthomonadaceae bacterium XH05]
MYGSLSEEIRFDQIMHRLGAVFRSSISGVHTEDFGAHRGRLTLVGDVTADEYVRLTDAYTHRWNGSNLWMERSLGGFQQQGYQHGDAVVSGHELRQSAYYRHFLKPLDIRYGLGIQIWSGDALNMAVASFHRGHGERGFGPDDIRTIHAIRPHMVNAYAIYRRIARLEGRVESLRAGFERAPLGMLILDAAGRALEVNDRAEECLLASQLARCNAEGLLHFTHSQTQQDFLAALATFACATAKPRTLPLHDAKGVRTSIALHLCRIPCGTLSGFDGRASVLGFIAELRRERFPQWAEHVIHTTLGLSHAEARVAFALLQHVEVATAAAALGLQPATVRTHVKSIHSKLGVSRSSDMLLMLDRLLGVGQG